MEINVLIGDGVEGCPPTSWLQAIAEQALTIEKTSHNVEMSLVITSQEKVQELNRNYRGKDEPTDVLAFPMAITMGKPKADSPPFVVPPDGMHHLGEVIISYPQAIIQAKEHHHSVRREIAILIIHGVLHLLGYEHDKPELRRQMRTREAEILSNVESSGYCR